MTHMDVGNAGIAGSNYLPQPKYAKLSPDPEVLHACVIANATGIEAKRMKEISDIKESDLERVGKNHVRY